MTERAKFLFRRPDHSFGSQVEPSQVIRFRSNEAFSGQTGQVDFQNCVVHGVSLITGNMEAEGHDLTVDSTTTTQLHKLAKDNEQVPVYLDHGSGIKELNGYLSNFRMDGNKLRGDWYLLHSHKETEVMLERADRQPKTFGLSVAFKGKGVKVLGGKKAARADKLLSADIVPRPAVNPDGLFGARDADQLTQQKSGMNRPGQTTEPTLADIMSGLTALTGRIDQMQQVQDTLVDHINQGTENQNEDRSQNGQIDPQVLAELDEMTDAELARYNQANNLDITRGEIDAAVSEYVAAVQAQRGEQNDDEGNDEGADGDEGAGELAGAGVMGSGDMGGAGGAQGSTAFRAMEKRLIQLEARLEKEDKRKKQEAARIQFESIGNKIDVIAGQRSELKQFAEQLVAENEALRMHVRTGTRPVTVGVDDGIRLFSANEDGELHQFQQVVKNVMTQRKCTEGQAIGFAIKQPGGNALHKDWLMSMQRTRN